MSKLAFYLLTRNIYQDVIPSLKSILKNGNIDQAWLLIEDDDIGFDLPEDVITYNISQWRDKYLDPDGPNYRCRWSYMVMMKVLLCNIFPYDKALTIDVDTIVRGDVSRLWDIDMTGYYIAGAREPFWSQRYHQDYVNAGVLMWNLQMMRDGMADRILRAMNTQPYTFVEQDALNYHCWDRIRVIGSEYNAGDWTEKPKEEIKIRHYMASKGLWKAEPEVLKYANMSWEEVFGYE